ncbi:MAG: dihydroneopterin aldolase [Desulfitobacteriaceae bacterium]|nr:dihydroneopterin aldolase [Desulfitobacteriaceae bacterium]MDI6878071.1 dihydroneopterin aldolase [Desulfitobacteriaceae bacterium]MDI6913941.1 dihydroneopterin aldolase [Desulfitobacteriaceae bacterium]
MVEHDIIHLRGLEFYAYHGVLPEEQRLGQKFIVDVDLYHDLQSAGISDEVGDTLNYAEVYAEIKGVVESGPYRLLEHLAEQIAETLLTTFPCDEVRVEVHKPQAPVPGLFRDISVEIRRGRKG